MAKILIVEGNNVSPLDEAKFALEGKLQDYLEGFPSLISLKEIDENASDLLCIGREIGAGPGSIDLLYIDENGLLTIVETKLARNPEARRTVIGQIIEYASYVCEWTVDKVEAIANAYLKSDLYEAMKEFAGGDFAADDFRTSIERNLQGGNFRLIIAVDELVEPLKKTVIYLNSHSDFNILLLLVKRFEEKDKKDRSIFVPSLFGYSITPPPPAGKRRRWNKESFFKEISDKWPKSVFSTMELLYEFTEEYADEITWGTGTQSGSFGFRLFRSPGDPQKVTVFTLYSNSGVVPGFGWMGGQIDEEVLESFRVNLNKIPGVEYMPEMILRPWSLPAIDLEVLSKSNHLKVFLGAVLDLRKAIKHEG